MFRVKLKAQSVGILYYLSSCKLSSKVSRQKLYLPRQKWRMKETLMFLKIVPLLSIKHLWSFSFDEVWSYVIIFLLMSSMFSNLFSLRWIIYFRNQKKLHHVGEYSLLHLYNLLFCQKSTKTCFVTSFCIGYDLFRKSFHLNLKS